MPEWYRCRNRDSSFGLVGRIARRRPEDSQIQVVAKQVLAHHTLAVLFVERGRERRCERPIRIVAISATNKMRPQGNPFIRDIAVERIQVTVERVKIEDIGSLEGDAVERHHHHQGAGVERDGRFINMPHIGNEGFGR